MTLSQSKQLYIDAGGDDGHSQSELEAIHKEMVAIVEAKTDRAAAKVIDWWDCWDSRYTATAFARRVRSGYSNLNHNEKLRDRTPNT